MLCVAPPQPIEYAIPLLKRMRILIPTFNQQMLEIIALRWRRVALGVWVHQFLRHLLHLNLITIGLSLYVE